MLRSTCMCYARRQRSSWARIKLSNKNVWFCQNFAWLIRSVKHFIFEINMSSFTGVSSIRNVQWKFQKNLQESILLILKTQYIFEFSGLFHCSVIKVLKLFLCCLSTGATLISYHSFFSLSTTFFNFFYFSWTLCRKSPVYAVSDLIFFYYPFLFFLDLLKKS